MDYLLWSIFGLSVIFVWLRINRRLFNDILSPFNLLLFSWIGPLFLRGFNLSELERPWTFEIIFLFLCVTFTLVLPLIAIHPLILRYPLYAQQLIFEKTVALFRRPRFILLILVCFVISFSAYLYNDFITNPVGIPLITYIQDPTTPRNAFHRWGRSGGAGIGLLAIPIFVVSPMFYLAFRSARHWSEKLIFLGFALIYPVMSILKLSRIELIQVCVSFVLIEYYSRQFLLKGTQSPTLGLRRKIQAAVLVAGLIVGIALVQPTFSQIRGGFTPGDGVRNRLIGYNLDIPEPFNDLSGEIYAYFAMPLENFANFYKANPDGGFNPGIGFLRPFFSLTGQGRAADTMLEQIDFLDGMRLWPVNTYPFITLIFAEFGLLGVFVVPPIYAVMVAFFYVRFRRGPTFVNFFLYLVCPYGWLWFFSAAAFTVLTFYLYLAFIIVFYLFYILIFRVRNAAKS